jgi:hypothetical protein
MDIKIQERLVDKTANDVNLDLYLAAVSMGYTDVPYIPAVIRYFWQNEVGDYVYPNDIALCADIYGRTNPLGTRISWRGKLLTLVYEYEQYAAAEYVQLEAMEYAGLVIESVPVVRYLVSSMW